jgi:hypothetical protein
MGDIKSIQPEHLRAVAWELWDWLGDGRTQNEPIESIEEITRKVIQVALADKDASLPDS